ncbi:MAG: nucleotidyltransferase domain-containing protein [Crocinitomicaceae bacterium]|nr:nucleotidyltransferase domain-containing protein [Crocinitomicaceae bacterium]
MKFGLADHTIENIQQVFSGFNEIEEVILYGSRAKGNYKEGSDIDLTIKGKVINKDFLNRLQIQLDQLYLPYTFDISCFEDLSNESLIDHIKRVGVSFYQKKNKE